MNVRAWIALFGLVAIGGGAFAWTRDKALRQVSRAQAAAPDAEPEKHKVTPEMLQKAEARAKKSAPTFRQADADGNTVDLAELVKSGPVVLVFIKDGCPCSTSAERYFDSIHAAYRGRVVFLGVIEGDAAVARRWGSEHGVPFPILPDPRLELARSYGATNSAFVALIDRSGSLVEFWPGYSSGMLRDLNRQVARLSGLTEEPVEFVDAPEELYSGCPFD